MRQIKLSSLLVLAAAASFAQALNSNGGVNVIGALPSGSNVIGHVITDSGSVVQLATGSNTIGALTANQSVNVAQVNGATTVVANNGQNSTGGGIQAVGLVGQLDDTSPNTCTENQFCNARLSSKGVLYGQIRDAAGNERGANVDGNNNLGVVLAAETTKVIGTARMLGNAGATLDAAPGATPPTNGLYFLFKGVNAEQTAVTNGQTVAPVTDLVGKQIFLPYANPENFLNGTTSAITDTTSTAVIASAGGSLRNYITACAATNSHASVDTFVKILDGSTIIWEELAVHGSGWNMTFPTPLRGTAATAINAQMVTTGANVIVSCTGYKGL